MMCAYEYHNILPDDWKKMSASDWNAIKSFSIVTKDKINLIRKMKIEEERLNAGMNAAIQGFL